MHTRSLPRRLSLTALAIAAAGALMLTGCTAGGTSPSSDSSDAKPRRGGNVTIRLAQDPGSLDSVASGNAGTTYINHEIYQQLVTINADYEPVPQLAESYERSDDGTTVTFTLRKGMKFSDGTRLTAKDAVASLQYWVDNNAFATSLKEVLDSITAPDDRTVVVTTKSPFNTVALMAGSDGSAVVKAEVAENAPAKGFSKEGAIGSGPYMLKSWTPGQEIVLERNPNFVQVPGEPSGYAGARHAYVDTITYKVVADPDAAVNGLRTGLWDVTGGTDEQYASLKTAKGLSAEPASGAAISILYLNHNPESKFSQAEVRDAFNWAIDKKAILAARGNPDLNKPTSSIAAEGDKAFYSTAGEDTFNEYDPAKAKKMFADAGFTSGDTITMLTTDEFPQFKEALVIVQDDLKKIGIKSKISSYDFGTMLGKAEDPNAWDVLALSMDGYPPIPQFSSTVRGLRAAGYDPPGYKEVLDAYNRATTPVEVRAAIDDIQAFSAKHKPTIILNEARSYVAYGDRVHNYDHWGWVFSNVWVDPKK